MSDTKAPRLDAATCKAVLEAMEYAGKHAWHSWHESAIDAVRDICARGMANPVTPTLSEWLAACEGTELGEPEFGGLWHIGGDTVVSLERSGDGMALRVDWLDARNDEDGRAYSVTHCSTPAELRAALEALAVKA